MDGKPDNDLDNHEKEIEYDTDHEGSVYLFKVHGMMVVTKAMVMTVIMIVIMRLSVGRLHGWNITL